MLQTHKLNTVPPFRKKSGVSVLGKSQPCCISVSSFIKWGWYLPCLHQRVSGSVYRKASVWQYSVFYKSIIHMWWIILRQKSESVSCSVVSNSLWPHGLSPTRLLHPWNSPGRNTGGGCHFLLWEIFPTQGLNPDLLYCKQILYHLSHQGSSFK